MAAPAIRTNRLREITAGGGAAINSWLAIPSSFSAEAYQKPASSIPPSSRATEHRAAAVRRAPDHDVEETRGDHPVVSSRSDSPVESVGSYRWTWPNFSRIE